MRKVILENLENLENIIFGEFSKTKIFPKTFGVVRI